MSIAHSHEVRIPPRTLGMRLRDSREFAGLDQYALAEALDVGRATISNYERGVTKPNRLQINAWAVTCDVDVEWLKTGDGDTDSPDGGPQNGRKPRNTDYGYGVSAIASLDAIRGSRWEERAALVPAATWIEAAA